MKLRKIVSGTGVDLSAVRLGRCTAAFFGYRSGFKCSALRQMYCSVEHCRFYKTAEQFERDRKRYPCRCTAALSTAGFTRRQSNLKEIGNDTRSWEPENSISVLEYLERRGVIAGGQEKT